MKLHRSLAEAVISALHAIFIENKYADRVIEKTLKQNPRWGARDRRFIAETTYDIVRWKRLYAECAYSDNFWAWLGCWLVQRNWDLPAWKEFSTLSVVALQNKLAANLPREVRESIPEWLDVLGANQLDKVWEHELSALNEQAQVVLRVNTLKISRHQLTELLLNEGLETTTVKDYPDALVLKRRSNIFNSTFFKEGLFEVMDGGSQLIPYFLEVEPGLRVIDACAGAGGKTLHLAALMKNKGKIISMDTEAWKLEELTKRARRAGAFNIETRVIESAKTIKRLENSADRVLLDVPCSGIGVLKRNPDAKWKLSLEFIQKVNALQKEILASYSLMVKPGGKLVYSTCSILPLENEQVVKQFLDIHPEFILEAEKNCLPSAGFDGFYMARMKKNP